MKQFLILFLKVVVLFIGVAVFIGLIIFPQTEGRAANLNQISIYNDPFIIYTFMASIPFFVLLYQVLKILGYFEQSNKNTSLSIKTLKNIKYCAVSLIALIFIGLLYIRLIVKGDDPAGPTGLGIIVIILFLLIFIAASIFQKKIQFEN